MMCSARTRLVCVKQIISNTKLNWRTTVQFYVKQFPSPQRYTRRPNQRLVENKNHPAKQIKVQQSSIHGAKKGCLFESCASFSPTQHQKPRRQIFHEIYIWVHWWHWILWFQYFNNLGSDSRILSNAPGGTIKTSHSLECPRHGSIQVDHKSNGLNWMSSLTSKASGIVH